MRPLVPKDHRRRSAALVIVLLLVLRAARAGEPILPTPPRQAELWAPPATSLPRFLASATAALGEQGLADPRGCAYHKVRITVGSVWGASEQEAATGGWVLPAAAGGKLTHAIAWNGLVYPLAGDDGPADLDADVRALVAAHGDARKDLAGPRRGFGAFGTNSEDSSVAGASLHAIKVCLLLRLGRADLAEAVWGAGTGLPPAPKPAAGAVKIDLNSYGVSYLSLARDLAWYHFDRAICAHMRGDDPIALADAHFLLAFDRAVEIKAEQMGFERPEQTTPRGEVPPYIEFLGQLPELLADQERRAWERAKPIAAGGKGREARVAALIRDLDQVAVRQWGQPGGVVLGESPIVKELIALGDVAVEPLIGDFRTDDRLTRSVGFHRDFFRSRTILRADQAAYTALTGILKVSNFAPPDPQRPRGPRRRDEVADEVLAYWRKNRAIPLVERWYETLADDEAGPKAWLEAAGNILQPENVRTVPGGGAFSVTESTALAPGERPMLRGEPLRTGHEPSVATLLARRVESMRKSPEGQRFELLDPCRMAALLADWDPLAAAPTLRAMTRLCRERYARPDNGHDWTNQNLAVSIAKFTLARDQAGDRQALREYAEWVRTAAPDWLEQNALAVLQPFLRKPDDPDLAAAADWLFGDPQSPWVPLIGRKGSRTSFHAAELIASPIVQVPAFRKMLIAALEDRTPIGRAEAGDNDSVNVQVDNGSSMGRGALQKVGDVPPRGTSMPLRTCDFYAWQLATLEKAPAFHPCWPEARRDAGVAAMANLLRRQGAR